MIHISDLVEPASEISLQLRSKLITVQRLLKSIHYTRLRVSPEMEVPQLVDLSLFAYSPTNDNNFTTHERAPSGHALVQTTTWPTTANRITTQSPAPSAVTMKPLPRVPRRGICEFIPDSRGNNRCILKRIKRVKLDTVLSTHDRSALRAATPSAYASAPSAYVNPNSASHTNLVITQNQTLQERRNPPVPTLTLPATSTTTQQRGLPMIWLQDEQMWLVADPTDPGYGYYADPDEEEWLPPYTESDSPASDPSSSDLSPVREQFMSLIEAPRPPPQITYDDPRASPLFQEAMVGVGVLDFVNSTDYGVPSPVEQPQQRSRGNTPGQYVAYHPSRGGQQGTAQSHHPSSRWYQQSLSTPRSESQALRSQSKINLHLDNVGVNWSKYSSEAEIRRQQERVERRRQQLHQDQMRSQSSMGLQRRESWHSDSGVSVASIPISPENRWGITRASSARH